MGVLNVLRIAGSALTAQRLRMDVTASNIANAEATATPEGGPYRAERVVFAPRREGNFASTFRLLRSAAESAPQGGGVEVRAIVASPQPPRQVYDPTHPDADADGYVTYPNVDLVTEMTDLLSASRAYEANLTVITVAKNMAQRALDIGRA
ncbi:MAG TPA: flagellar basal body rod protein FlgC [Chloroflexota bacterium]|jgi:flagellar basal-body rod protein FlgC|nr:flagellar basal body rod protein FlgC [Chloroflexota bacterium]